MEDRERGERRKGRRNDTGEHMGEESRGRRGENILPLVQGRGEAGEAGEVGEESRDKRERERKEHFTTCSR